MSAEAAEVYALNSYLRGELAAAESYRRALGRVSSGHVRGVLEACLASHAQRARLFSARIVEREGEAASKSGPWGVFSKLTEAQKALGDAAVIAALADGEAQTLADYQTDPELLDEATRSWIEERILPLQEQTQAALLSLRDSFTASGVDGTR